MAKRTISRRRFLESSGTALTIVAAAPALRAQQKTTPPVPQTAITLTVNGTARRLEVEDRWTLVEALRDHAGLTGTKIGCDRGACSACTVWLDGEVAASCMTLALDARGRRITTIEGLADGATLHAVQRAFVEHDAMQCGFCTPGMVMSCAALVERNPACTLEDVKAAVSGHLCRCGTYPNVFKATLAAASRLRTPAAEAESRR